MIRPLRHRLSDLAVAVMAEQRAAGMAQMPIHLMLVDESGPRERGDAGQVTCHPCLEQVHA